MRVSTLCLALFACVAFGQSDRGAIEGTVTNPVSGVRANAPIQAKNTATGTVYKATSSASGGGKGSDVGTRSSGVSAFSR